MLKNLLISEAIGDVAGSVYEFHPEKDIHKIELLSERSTYTDDTVCTFAIAEAFLHGKDIAKTLRSRCLSEPGRGYGSNFHKWIDNPFGKPYGSFGNGSAMRCSAAGFIAHNEEECIRLATMSAECTHNHPEGIKGSVATALAIHYLMQGEDKSYVRAHVLNKYYPLFKSQSIDEIKPAYGFNESCQGTVPVSLICFLESIDYEDCLKQSISMGGDADTLAAIAGPLAYAYFRHMPQRLVNAVRGKLPEWMLEVNDELDALVEKRGCVKNRLNRTIL